VALQKCDKGVTKDAKTIEMARLFVYTVYVVHRQRRKRDLLALLNSLSFGSDGAPEPTWAAKKDKSQMAGLAINLFGTFQVTLDHRPVHFATEKCRAFLAYLAVEAERPHRREVLSDLFWPEQPETAARTNLRQTLHRLRSAVGDLSNSSPFLLVSNHDVQINPAGKYWLDVAGFETALQAYQFHCGQGLPLCSNCQEGDFMAGFSLTDNSPFELWRLAKREHYHRQAMETLERLAQFYEETADFARAVECARRLIIFESWWEEYHRLLMRNLAHAGQRQAALTQYEQCRQELAKELGVEPSAETQELYEAIRDLESAALEE
jgi:DNA-binding SARP family transcriptional activator